MSQLSHIHAAPLTSGQKHITTMRLMKSKYESSATTNPTDKKEPGRNRRSRGGGFIPQWREKYHFQYVIGAGTERVADRRPSSGSTSAKDSLIGSRTFCRTFPWHFITDRGMRILQLGTGLSALFGHDDVVGVRRVSEFFEVLGPDPDLELEWENITLRLNVPFTLRVKKVLNGISKLTIGMELKGQMVSCEESDSLLFLGSPLVDGLDSLTSKGLYISDIPVYDMTRDVMLVGEHSRAQESLKRRMDALKKSIEEASHAVDLEQEKNVNLLHLIFPPDIAKRLWLGETIEAKQHKEVTMLFSDIVGFTGICASATPLQVIDMLQQLYTQFDSLCDQFDVYKVETIGDAYCVAGGLHKPSTTHAQRTAWMALRMKQICSHHRTHDGLPIRMRIGLHTGDVLAGVVGRTMPRYCMFGNNVSLTNKFESLSQPQEINVSPTTYE
ncbi:unnamed protein product [Darwinula stevensoni]|uniref:guanylate cyclase n=1 Tax=Darwinula stevensoni TaxID=69355 RepID=A0A7R9A766_9CRUS|nr:unnamed protein product [Darwinula stevensoni]CAG0891842.1 unnamed protein product [Darwinula stevensoni]